MKTYQKTLLALTLGALTATASADVILYGQIRGGVKVTKVKDVEGTTTQIADFGSRIGFKGHEHLNGGLKAIWQLEQNVNIGGGNTSSGNPTGFGTRNSFIGLEGDKIGRVRAGYIDTPTNAWATEYLDPWLGDVGVGSSKALGRSTDATGRRVAVDYFTPRVGGVNAGVYVSPSDNNSGSVAGRDSAVYGAVVDFKNDTAFANLSGTYVKNGVNNVTDKHAYQATAQAGVDNGKVLAGVIYQRSEHVHSTMDKIQEAGLTAAYKMDNGLQLKGSAVYGFKLKDTTGNKLGKGNYKSGTLGASYHLSKRTELFGNGEYHVNYDETKTTTFVSGIRHRF